MTLAAVADPIHDQHILVLYAAVEGLDLLVKGLRRRDTTDRCPLCQYSPDVVRYFLRNWAELAASTDGVSASGRNPIGNRADPDARRTLCAIKADLESATDRALEPLIRWHTVARIYRRQSRFWRYIELRACSLLNLHHPEPSAPLAEAYCFDLIARSLGWFPHDVCRS